MVLVDLKVFMTGSLYPEQRGLSVYVSCSKEFTSCYLWITDQYTSCVQSFAPSISKKNSYVWLYMVVFVFVHAGTVSCL